MIRVLFSLLVWAAAGSGVLAEKMLLFDFSDEHAVGDWVSINDVVMGGVSSGRLESSGGGTAVFTGIVSLENNGGFASVRSRPRKRDLGGFSGLEIRVRGDGRRYKLGLKTDGNLDGVVYRVAFDTVADEWQTIRVPFGDFRATFRGRLVPDAPPLDLSRVFSLGLMISDGQVGRFRLEAVRIAAYAE